MPKQIPLAEQIERRILPAAHLRAAKKDEKDVIEGQSAVFGQYSEDLGGFVEIIEPGFFDGTLEGDTRALFNHDSNYVLGRTTAGTLELEQDDAGLNCRIYPPETTWARDLLISIRRGDITQQSFGFMVKRLERGDEMDGDEWYVLGDKIVHRLKKGGCRELFDVSPVTYPAYPQTNVAADTRSRFETFRKSNPEPQDELPGGSPSAEPQADEAAQQQALRASRQRRMDLAEKS